MRFALPVFESAQVSFLCGERREDCRCTHSIVQGREVLNYQRKCRAGGHHVAPFGHGFLPLPKFDGNSELFVRQSVKIAKTAAILQFLSEFFEISGKLRLFKREDCHSAGRDSDGVRFLIIKEFERLRIDLGSTDSALQMKDGEFWRDINLLGLLKQVGDGVVYGNVFIGWNGEIKHLGSEGW